MREGLESIAFEPQDCIVRIDLVAGIGVDAPPYPVICRQSSMWEISKSRAHKKTDVAKHANREDRENSPDQVISYRDAGLNQFSA
jgi:hypothetical protein